ASTGRRAAVLLGVSAAQIPRTRLAGPRYTRSPSRDHPRRTKAERARESPARERSLWLHGNCARPFLVVARRLIARAPHRTAPDSRPYRATFGRSPGSGRRAGSVRPQD